MATDMQEGGCGLRNIDAAASHRLALGLALWQQCEQGDGCDLQLEHPGGILTFHRCFLNAAFPQLILQPETSEQVVLCELMALPFSILRGVLYLLYTGHLDSTCLEIVEELHSACIKLGLSTLVDIVEEVQSSMELTQSSASSPLIKVEDVIQKTEHVPTLLDQHTATNGDTCISHTDQNSEFKKQCVLQTMLCSSDPVVDYSQKLLMKEEEIGVMYPPDKSHQVVNHVTDDNHILEISTLSSPTDNIKEIKEEFALESDIVLPDVDETDPEETDSGLYYVVETDKAHNVDTGDSTEDLLSVHAQIPQKGKVKTMLDGDNTSGCNVADTEISAHAEDSESTCKSDNFNITRVKYGDRSILVSKSKEASIRNVDVTEDTCCITNTCESESESQMQKDTRFAVDDNPRSMQTDVSDKEHEHTEVDSQPQEILATIEVAEPKVTMTKSGRQVISCDVPHGAVGMSLSQSMKACGNQSMLVITKNKDGSSKRTFVMVKKKEKFCTPKKCKKDIHATLKVTGTDFCENKSLNDACRSKKVSSGMKQPIITTFSKKLACPSCGDKLRTRKHLYIHRALQHDWSLHNQQEFPVLQCQESGCNFETIYRVQLADHLKMKHDKKLAKASRHVCEFCGLVAVTPSSLAAHRNTHTGNRPFACHLCDKKFRTNPSLRSHVLGVHKRKEEMQTWRYQCNDCDYRALSAYPLRVHRMKKHAVAYPGCQLWPCEQCSHVAMTPAALKIHCTKHSDERAYHCDICGMSFRTKGTLKGHQVVHESRNVHCPHCAHVTSTKKLLLRHISRVHAPANETQPYQCVHCNYRGRLLSHISKHVKAMHSKETKKKKVPTATLR